MKNHAPAPSLTPPRINWPSRKDVAPGSLGVNAVEAAEQAVYFDTIADQLETTRPAAAALQESKVHPNSQGRIGRAIARRTGKLMTAQEAALVDFVDQHEHLTSAHKQREVAEQQRQYAHSALEGVRDRLKRIDLELPDEFFLSIYLADLAPDALHDAKRKTAPHVTWRKWLSESADDDQLLELLQEHLDRVEKRNKDPEKQQQYEAGRHAYKQALSESIGAGWLHEDAQSAIDKADGIKIYEGDMFDTFLEGATGYHVIGQSHIVVTSTDQEHLNHELNHAVLGDLGARWRTEAVTEHIASALTSGEPDVLDPAQRNNDRDVYVDERALYADLLRDVPVRLATRAYSESLDKHAVKDELEAAINKAWSHVLPQGESATELMNKHLSNLEQQARAEKKSPSEAQEFALQTARTDLREHPEIIFNPSESSADDADSQEKQPGNLMALQASDVALAQLIDVMLAGSRGILKRPSPETTEDLSASVKEVDAEVKDLRSQGIPEKKALRTLVKQYHTDATQGDGEKIRAVNQRLEEFNRREGKRIAKNQ